MKGEMSVSVLDNITRKVTDTAKAAAKMSGNVVEVTRLNMSINAEEEKIRKIYTEMGKQLYEDYTEGKIVGEKLLENCTRIDEIIGNIDDMREKILELRNVKACPNCGMELDVDMVYCYKCGKKQEMPVVQEIQSKPEETPQDKE
ncbi:MAG TPA: zinc ribbon domain-containing protein [Clostridia bacterium]|nr:zinc ribbon domain-containing protein [Clostridia bacterium]